VIARLIDGHQFIHPGNKKSPMSPDSGTWYRVFIGGFQLLTNGGAGPTRRRFSFKPTTYQEPDTVGAGVLYIMGESVYLMELTNVLADKKTDLQTFIKGARVTFFKFGWIEM
jgi:hypothetical protein